MSRATQWEPLCGTDPTPGEADEVESAGRHYSSMADEIEGQVRRLNDIVDGTLQGGYVQALTAAADGLKDELGKTSGRYREVGGALEGWAPQLREFQDEAEWLRQQALTAQGDMSDNRSIPQISAPDAPPPSDQEVAATRARQGRYDDARGDLSRAQGRLADLTERRDDAAGRVADVIREKCDDDVANSRWDNFKDWMDQHAELVSGICKVLGVIAMAACVVALLVPGLNVLALGVLVGVATAGSLVGHTMLASTGNGSWVDVGMDVFALATLGAGRFLGPGLKILGKQFGGSLGRLTAETRAAGAMARGNAARGPIQARINAQVAHAEQRLVGGASGRLTRRVRREVIAIRAQGASQSQVAHNAAESAYLARAPKTTVMDRLVLGGGDSELAALRVASQDAAIGFSTTSKVGLAAARANTQYVTAVGAMGSSTGASLWSTVTDFYDVKPYNDFRDRLVTKEGAGP